MNLGFIAGTKISTELYGNLPIEEIKVGDKVLTSRGIFPVISVNEQKCKDILKVKFANGSELFTNQCQEVKTLDCDCFYWENLANFEVPDTDMVRLELRVVTEYTNNGDMWGFNTDCLLTPTTNISLTHMGMMWFNYFDNSQILHNIVVDKVYEYYANGICVKS